MILDENGADVRATEHVGYPLPPPDGRPPVGMSRGRYMVPHPGTGVPTSYARATSLAGALDDTYHLERWKERMAFQGAATDPALLRKYRAAAENGAGAYKLNAIIEDARIAAGSADASEFGTATHAWLEAIDQGRIIPSMVPEIYRPHVDAYLNRLADYAVRPVPELTERTVINLRYGVVGTFDRVYLLPDGRMVMGDVKTSKTLQYGYLSFSMQLAIYADADYMLSIDGKTWEPMPELVDEWALLAHVPSNAPENASAVPFDLNYGRTGLEAAQLVKDLRAGAKTSVPHRHALPTPPTNAVRFARAANAVKTSATAADLATVWTEYQDVWTDDLTSLGHAVIEAHATQRNA